MSYFFGNSDVVPGVKFTIDREPYTDLEVFGKWAVRTLGQFNDCIEILNTETGDIIGIRSCEIPDDCERIFGYGTPSIIQTNDGEFYLKVENEDGDYILFDFANFEFIDEEDDMNLVEIPENTDWEIVIYDFEYSIIYQQCMEEG